MIVKMVLVPGLNPGRYMIIYLLHIETLSLSIIHLRLEPGIASNAICCILVFLDSLANHLQMGYIHMNIVGNVTNVVTDFFALICIMAGISRVK